MRTGTDHWLEEQCKHGFETPGTCPVCKGKVDPPRPSRDVFIVDNSLGEAYHSRSDCNLLRNAKADVVRVSEASVQGTHHLCPACFTKEGKAR